MLTNCKKCGKFIPNQRTKARIKGLCTKRCNGVLKDGGGIPKDPILRSQYLQARKKHKKDKALKRIIENRKYALPVKYIISNIKKERAPGTIFYVSEAWQKLRYETIKKYERKCMVCFATNVELHVDHIKPRSKFPELELDPNNLQVLCRPCNLGKSNTDSIDWRPTCP